MKVLVRYGSELKTRLGIDMGDSSCHIKIEFSIYNKKFKDEWYINFTPNGEYGCDCDSRIIKWFEDCYKEGHSEWQAGIDEYFAKQREDDKRKTELKQLERLLEKYPAYKGSFHD